MTDCRVRRTEGQGPVLVTGANGRLAGFVLEVFGDREVVRVARQELDIADWAAVRRLVEATRPAVIINCAGYNDVDGAEDAAELAMAANAFGVRHLARAAAACGARLVHFSTDFVFDGEGDRPYLETDRTRPMSVYAASKWLGERFALEAPEALVLRVESLFGCRPGWVGPLGSLDAMVVRMRAGEPVRAFTDRVVTPSYMGDVALAARHLVDTEAAGGIYHCVNSGVETWDRVAAEALRVIGGPSRIEPISLTTVTLRAARPRYCALSNEKLASAGYPMPTWQNAIQRWLGAEASAGEPGATRQ